MSRLVPKQGARLCSTWYPTQIKILYSGKHFDSTLVVLPNFIVHMSAGVQLGVMGMAASSLCMERRPTKRINMPSSVVREKAERERGAPSMLRPIPTQVGSLNSSGQ